MIPYTKVRGLPVANLPSGSVVTEQVFAWPGTCLLLIGAIDGRDMAVVQKIEIFSALAVIVVDAIVAIPNIILYLTVLGVFDPRIGLLIIIGVINWTTFARVVRAEALAVKKRKFIESTRTIGLRAPAIILRHVLPSVSRSIIVVATVNIASVSVLEAVPSYLGFGVEPPTVTWGRMLADGRAHMATAWWLATFPGLAITLLTPSFLVLGDWFRDLFDPRQR